LKIFDSIGYGGYKLYSIDQVIKGNVTFEQVKSDLKKAKLDGLVETINEAEFVMFGDLGIDLEALFDFNQGLSELLTEEFIQYRLTNKDDYVEMYQRSSKRLLDQVIYDSQPSIDSPFLAVLALRLCIKAINQADKGDITNTLPIAIEASEAIALTRLSSDYLALKEDLDYELTRKQRPVSKAKISQAAKANNAIMQHQKTIKYAAFNKELQAFASFVWKHESTVTPSIIAKEVNEVANANLRAIAKLEMSKPSVEKMIAFLTDIAPKTAINSSRTNSIVNKTSKNKITYKVLVSSLVDDFSLIFCE